MPGKTTITIFRRRLERRGLARLLFKEIKGHLDERGFSLKEGTIVDAVVGREREQGPRPGDAPDEEGELAEFRDEAARWHRPPVAGVPSGWNGRERRDLDAFGLASAQRGEAGPSGASVPNRGKPADAARKSNSHSQTNQRLLNQDVWEWQETLVEQY